MDSIFAVLFLASSAIAILSIIAYFDAKHNNTIHTNTLKSIIDSHKIELREKESQIKELSKGIDSISESEKEHPPQLPHLYVNYRPSEEYSLKIQCDILEKENQALKKQLQDIDEKSPLYSKPHASPKVETADRDFLLQALGEKSKEISQLRSNLAQMHHLNDQLQTKLKSQDDTAQQLNYLRSLYPTIDEILSARPDPVSSVAGYNYTRGYLSQNEWNNLSEAQRNQLALDRYVKSHNKTKWQIGRDYELYVAHMYRQQGYDVDPCGSYLQLEDMGRDLILSKGEQIRIVQCKYWSSSKEIHERFIFLLYGSVVSYCIENNIPQSYAKGIFVTNIKLSSMARQCADILGIIIKEQFPLGDFPRIKCNVTKDASGEYVYIYHLPMDPQYDRVKIKNERECYASTVEEAESYGFRRTLQ